MLNGEYSTLRCTYEVIPGRGFCLQIRQRQFSLTKMIPNFTDSSADRMVVRDLSPFFFHMCLESEIFPPQC